MLDAALLARYDLVGFDPRGVGQSDPVQCLTDSQMDQFVDTPSNPRHPGRARAASSRSRSCSPSSARRSRARYCRTSAPWTRPGTWTYCAAALGDKQLNYLGKSYGTLLGATYAQEFPQRVGRLVLDGAIDPNLTAEQENLTQAASFDKELHLFLADCVKQSNCPLGTTDPNAAFDKLQAWVAGLETQPITGDGTRKLDEAYALTGISVAMYDQTWWPTLRQALTSAFKGNGATLLAMADAYNDRSNGHYTDNEIAANYAVNCVDHPDEATSVAQIQAAAAHLREGTRRSSARWSTGPACPAPTGRRSRPTPRTPSPPAAPPRSSSSAPPTTRPPRTPGRRTWPRSSPTAAC